VLRSPLSIRLELQVAKLPLSKLSAKIRSPTLAVELGVCVCVRVGIAVDVPVKVGVRDGPISVKVAVAVALFVGVTVKVDVFVPVGVRLGVEVRVSVGVCVDFPLGVLVRLGVGEGPAVDVGGGLSTALSAAAASTIPLPQVVVVQLLPGGKARVVLWRIWRLCVKLSVGLSDTIRDRTPVICGAAILVPW
jgi:hypothetical protein